MYEYFNTLSKHFVGCKNPFFLVFVFIWHVIALAHTLMALAHPNSTEKLHQLKLKVQSFIMYQGFNEKSTTYLCSKG